ncbi:MAG: hypothetical protein IJJ04_02755 [Clostridia bacterium]|nr:hypothetical protein [Clostridia bacterium]
MLKSKILVSAISALITLSSIFVVPATYAVKVSTEIHQTNDLPKVLKNYKNFHDEIYNQKKDSEKYTDEEIRVIENFLRKAVDESDFSIAVSVDLIDSIIENDKFQSVVERCWDFIKEDSEYDETCLTRRFAPQEFFNVNVKNLVKSDYVKYGY